MSSQDPYSLLGLPNGVNLGGLGGITIDPTTGQISIGGTSGSGSYPWPTGGNPTGGAPASTGTSGSSSTGNSLLDWLKNNAGQVAGAGATALGAYLNYQAQQARNNLLQQQISSNNTVSAADQARRDYYASILMPKILQGLRSNDPATMAAVQGQQAQAMHFPAPLSFSGTGVTQAPAATATPAATPTPVGTVNPAASAGNFTTSTNPAAGSTTFNQAYSAATGQIPNSGYLYNPNLDSSQI